MLEIHASTDRDVVAGLRARWSFSLSQLDAGGGNERVVICSLEMLMVDIGVKNEGIREPSTRTLYRPRPFIFRSPF